MSSTAPSHNQEMHSLIINPDLGVSPFGRTIIKKNIEIIKQACSSHIDKETTR